MKWTQEQLAEISTLQEKHSLTRKSAVQRYRRQLKAQGNAAPAPAAPIDVLQEPGTPDNSAPETQTRGLAHLYAFCKGGDGEDSIP